MAMDSNVAAVTSDEVSKNPTEDSKYVKVHLIGYPVGRKINLKAHDNYESFSQAIQKMFDNLFSVNYSMLIQENAGEPKEILTKKHPLLIYEDDQGDHILVGDVPWVMFVSSVKRLYIVSCPKKQAASSGTASQGGEASSR